MTKENRIEILKFKIAVIRNKGDVVKRAGVLRKLQRQLRNLEEE